MSAINKDLELLSSDWLLPVTSPPVHFGGLVFNGQHKIVDYGPVSDLEAKHKIPSNHRRHFESSVIMPSLVNSHAHLYYTAHKEFLPDTDSYSDWLNELVVSRDKIKREAIERGINDAAHLLYKRGVSLVGNICSEMLWDAAIMSQTELKGVNFLEVIEIHPKKIEEKLKAIPSARELEKTSDGRFRNVPVPHSVFGDSASMIGYLLDYAEQMKAPSCIHLCESEDEVLMYTQGKGKILEFLREADSFYANWQHPAMSPVRYLNEHNLLRNNLVAIHLVNVDEEDIRILAEHGVRGVLCPASNRFLGVGKAPLGLFLEHGMQLGIGTDSLASNWDLDMFQEMAFLKEDHPEISSELIVEMATINGADILGWGGSYGSIEVGKQADVIVLPLHEKIDQDSILYDYIVTNADGDEIFRPVNESSG